MQKNKNRQFTVIEEPGDTISPSRFITKSQELKQGRKTDE